MQQGRQLLTDIPAPAALPFTPFPPHPSPPLPSPPPCSDLLPCVVFVFSKKRIDALADNLQVGWLPCLPCCRSRLPAACSCPGRQPAGKTRLNCCWLLLPPALPRLLPWDAVLLGLALPCLALPHHLAHLTSICPFPPVLSRWTRCVGVASDRGAMPACIRCILPPPACLPACAVAGPDHRWGEERDSGVLRKGAGTAQGHRPRAAAGGWLGG